MENVFSGLSLVIVVGTGMAFLMRLIRQPLIIGHILTGIIVGPAALHLINNPDTFATFSSIGIALLLFIVGLGLNPKVIAELSKVVGIVGITGVMAITLIAGAGSLFFGLDQTEALFFGIGLSFSSTIIILKLLSDRHETLRLHGKIIIGVTLIEDVMATLALLFTIAKGDGSEFSIGSVCFLAMKGISIGYAMFLISKYILEKSHKFIASSSEFLFLFAIAWGFGSAALFESIGFSHEVGALFAGILLADLPYAQEIGSRLRPLRDFFLVLFFITLGAGLSFGHIESLLPLIIFGVITVGFIKPFIIMILLEILGYTRRTSFKASVISGQVSEFSLIFAGLGLRQGLIDSEVLYALTFITLISIAMTTYLFTYNEIIYKLLRYRFLRFVKKQPKQADNIHTQSYELVLFGFQKGGHEFLRVFRQLKKPYVVIDYDPEMVDTLERDKINYIYGDASDIDLLEEVGIDKAKLVVSTITDHQSTITLLNFLSKNNKDAVSICLAETPQHAIELYNLGASYVMLPHYLGSEKISSLIQKVGYSRSEFRKIRTRHLEYIEAQLSLFNHEEKRQHNIGQAIIKNIASMKITEK